MLTHTVLCRGLHAPFSFKGLGRGDCSTSCRHSDGMPGVWYTFQLCYLELDRLQTDVVIRSRCWCYPGPCMGSFYSVDACLQIREVFRDAPNAAAKMLHCRNFPHMLLEALLNLTLVCSCGAFHLLHSATQAPQGSVQTIQSGFQCGGLLVKFTDCVDKTILVSLQSALNLGDQGLQG